MDAVVSVNGMISPAATATVSVFDHGFLYGEGIYETLRTYDRRPFLFDRHVRRLRRSADLMSLSVPWSDTELAARVADTTDAHGRLGEAYIRILVTRGVGDLSYALSATPEPSLIVIVKRFVPPPERTITRGIALALVGVRRNHPQALDPMIKSNNLMNNALAMQEAARRGADEALMQNQAGELAECSQSNFFLVKDGVALTPPLSAGLLPGVTREFLLEIAHELGIDARETRLVPADLLTADEVFISGTTREVTPVVSVDGRSIGAGSPGPVTRRLHAEFLGRVAAMGSSRPAPAPRL